MLAKTEGTLHLVEGLALGQDQQRGLTTTLGKVRAALHELLGGAAFGALLGLMGLPADPNVAWAFYFEYR